MGADIAGGTLPVFYFINSDTVERVDRSSAGQPPDEGHVGRIHDKDRS